MQNIVLLRRPSLGFLAMIAVVLFAVGTGYAGSWRFQHQVVYVGLERPDDVTVADVNGDGLPDLVVSEDTGMSWFENLGGDIPGWERHNPVSASADLRQWMALWTGDFDADGDVDIVACAKENNRGYVFENANGQGTEWTMRQLPYDGDDIADHSRTFDFNQDGRDDIILQKYHGGGVYYMPAPKEPGGKWEIYQIGTGHAGVALHDVNLDGHMDVLVNNTWLENPGKPASKNWTMHEIPHSRDGVKTAAGDLNGDGQTDFGHAEEEGDECYVVLSPNFNRITLKTDGHGLHSMKFDDFDKDGDLDLLTADIHGGEAYIFENAFGKGVHWIEHRLPTWSQQGSHNLWTGDLNGDGMIDIVGKHYETGSALEVWYNTLRIP